MKNGFSVLFFLFSVETLVSQTAPGIEWQRVIGGSSGDYLSSIQITDDDGYILAGDSHSGISGDKTESNLGGLDYWVIKIDSNLQIVWQNSFRGTGYDDLQDMRLTSDGGCVVGGSSQSPHSADKSEDYFASSSGYSTYDYWVVKVDALGGLEWENTIGGDQNDYFTTLLQASDGGYLVGGWSYSGISGDKTEAGFVTYGDYWILKLDNEGNIEWQNTIGGNTYDYLVKANQTLDGGYILGSYSDSEASGDKTESRIDDGIGLCCYSDYWIVKIDSLGNVEWDETIGGYEEEILTDIKQTSDGGYIVGGHSKSGVSGDKTEGVIAGFDYWILKLNPSGNIQWQRTLGGDKDDICTSVEIANDGFLVGGYSLSDASGNKSENTIGTGDKNDYWIVKLDLLGNVMWDNTIGGAGHDYLTSIQHLSDESFLLGGYSDSKISGDKLYPRKGGTDYWVVKLVPETACSLTATISPTGPTTFCIPGDVTLNASTGTGFIYQWKKDGINISGATSASYTASATANYSVEITSSICSDISDEISVTAVSKPAATIDNLDAFNDICFDPSIKLKANSGAGYSYKWYKDEIPIAGATSQIFYATEEGLYVVKVTNSTGCSKLSAPYTIINTCKMSIGHIYQSNKIITIYPNPSSGTFTLEFDEVLQDHLLSISIKNLLGEEVYHQQIITSGEYHIQLDKNIVNGMYVIEVASGGKTFSQQIIVSR
ncbi:MAG: T9SS type A sorting domain-containing protein [Chitinophagales bacterium]